MYKSFIIKTIHVVIFMLFVLFYVGYEEQQMVGAFMYHVDQTMTFAPYANIFLIFATFLMGCCSIMGRWPKIFFSRWLLLMYVYICIVSLYHGPNTGNGGIVPYIVLMCNVFLPLLVYNFAYNMVFKVPQVILEFFMGVGLVFLAFAYALMFRKVMASYILDEKFRDGTVYIFMMFIPFVMTYTNKKVRNIGLTVICLALATSLKRGALVTIVLLLILYYIIDQRISEKKIPRMVKLVAFGGVFVFIIGGLVYLNSYTDGVILERFSSIDSDGGSGRDVVYATTLGMIADSDFISLLIGHGWNYVLLDSPLGVSAHNDFIESMYDLGVGGVVFLFVLFVQIALCSVKLISQKSVYAPAYACSFLIIFINSMISHVFLYIFNITALTLFWGYVAGKEQKRLEEKNICQSNRIEENV